MPAAADSASAAPVDLDDEYADVDYTDDPHSGGEPGAAQTKETAWASKIDFCFPRGKTSLEKLQLRSESAGDYFWGVSQGGTLQGFVCGTLTTGTMLTEESMSVHEPKVRGTCLRASHHTWPHILSYIPLSYRPLLRPLGAFTLGTPRPFVLYWGCPIWPQFWAL